MSTPIVPSDLLEALPEALALVTREGVIVGFNAALAARTHEVSAGASIAALVADEEGERVRDAIADVATARDRAARPRLVVRSAGDRATASTWELTFAPIGAGDAPCVLVRFDDVIARERAHITAQMQAERALRESERRFAATFHAMPYSVSVSDLATGRYLDCNAGFERVSGYRRDEVVGRTSMELDLWVDPEDRRRLVEEIAKHGKVRDLEIRFRAKGGRVVHALCHCDVIEVDGRPCLVNTFEDVSERLRVDQALRDAERERSRAAEEFRLVFESSPIGLALFDRQGKSLRYNEAFRRFLGRTSSSTTFELRDLVHPEREAEDRAMFEALREGRGETRVVEKPFLRADGTTVYGRLTLAETREPERGLAPWFCMIEDVDARRRAEAERAALEAQLRQAQKLESLGTLAGGIAHDFNNILSAILSFTELALLDANDPTRVRRYLEQIHVANERARDLVRQILMFSRRQKQERRPTSLLPIFTEALELLESSLPKRIRFETSFDDDITVVADATQIHQVIMNLCTNAAQAIGDRAGTIRVRLHRLPAERSADLGLDPERTCAELVVADDGVGMDADTMRQIFDPFFTTKPPGEGTGLGLSVVHGIVNEHEGTIRVSSRPGEGTTFRVYLPELRAIAPHGRARVEEEWTKGTFDRVLLVDDEPQVIEATSIGLERLGFHVTAFHDPKIAIEHFARSPDAFDMILTDYSMPTISGIELARAVLDLRPTMPIVLMTGYRDVAADASLRDLGVREVVSKPARLRDLAAALRRARETNAS